MEILNSYWLGALMAEFKIDLIVWKCTEPSTEPSTEFIV